MTTEDRVIDSLESVLVPAVQRSIVGMNLVREVTVNNGSVTIGLASTGLVPGAQDWIRDKACEAVRDLPEVQEVVVEYSAVEAKDLNQIGNIIAIMSGKGGVGKSLVTSLAAVGLRRQGLEVGILDADITGPSIPRMFGIKGAPSGNESGLLPVPTKTGIEVMSINLILPSEDDAVIWRGPLIGSAIKQFGEEVLWGKLDYLLIDLPPGTADAPLTVLQSFPVSGVVIVFTPQDLTAMIVRKAVRMAQTMEKPVLGVVENMAHLYVPEIDKKIELFGPSRAHEMARAASAPLLGQLPIDPALAKLCDEGRVEVYDGDIVRQLGEALAKAAAVKVP